MVADEAIAATIEEADEQYGEELMLMLAVKHRDKRKLIDAT